MTPPSATKVSGKYLGLGAGACLILSAILVPRAAHLPRWIEYELVLGVWWLVWWVILSGLLFYRADVENDLPEPRAKLLKNLPYDEAHGCLEAGNLGCGAFDSCAAGILWVLGIVLIGLALLVVIELLIPAIALVLCFCIRGMLVQAIRRHPVCIDHPGLSMLWGGIWATVYTLPIGLLIWGIQHWMVGRYR